MKAIIDILLLIIIALCTWSGYKRGLVGGVASLLAIVIALLGGSIIAAAYSHEVVPAFEPFVDGYVDSGKMRTAVLEKMGYGKGVVTQRTGDEGIDGIINEDKLGLDIIHIQAKRYKPDNKVGRPLIQGFVGALDGAGINKGVFITTSSFTKEAMDYKSSKKIAKIDGKQLTNLMIQYNVGVTTEYTYEVKRIDKDFFDE